MAEMFAQKLPSAGVRFCALADGWPYITHALQARGITVVQVPAHPALPGPVQCHADLQMHPLPDGRILLARETPALSRQLTQVGFVVEHCTKPLGNVYPQDVPLCSFALDGKLYGLPKAMATEIKEAYPEIVPVRQGYARCSTCIVDAHSIITADEGIARAARSNGIAVLHIQPGYIALPGYAYGFIGGCTGLLDPHTLAFTGNLDTHPDAGAIHSFCAGRGVEVVCLCDGPLQDIGSLLPLA